MILTSAMASSIFLYFESDMSLMNLMLSAQNVIFALELTHNSQMIIKECFFSKLSQNFNVQRRSLQQKNSQIPSTLNICDFGTRNFNYPQTKKASRFPSLIIKVKILRPVNPKNVLITIIFKLFALLYLWSEKPQIQYP